MKKGLWIWAGGMLWFLFLGVSWSWAGEPWQDIGKDILNVKTLLIDSVNPRVMYLGSERGVFKTEDAGGSWRNVFLAKGEKRGVNLLIFDPQERNAVYAATAAGFFRSPDQGGRWARIFKGKNYFEADCLSAAVLPGGIYLGTSRGLFISRDKGRSWHKELGKLGNAQIFNIACPAGEADGVYLSSTEGIFRSNDAGKSWERVFITYPAESEQEAEAKDEDQDEEARYSKVRYVVVDPRNAKCLYLATSRGIYESEDGGLSWERFSEEGLLSRDVYFLLFSGQAQLYCVSKPGIFIYQDSRWRELSFTLGVNKINFIALDKDGRLYACADKGLFKLGLSPVSMPGGPDVLTGYFQDEPKITEVQKAAIKYAEVDPDKITRWRKQAVKKAWLPKLSANLGRDTTDLWHWETGSSAIGQSGDDLLRRGKDSLDWDVGLSWDLGELIWNADQTSIDARSRLMVELRNDVLDEVNKLYFERIRVKMELDSLSIEERKKRFEKELRIKELAAALDALTGGYFSRQIAK